MQDICELEFSLFSSGRLNADAKRHHIQFSTDENKSASTKPAHLL